MNLLISTPNTNPPGGGYHLAESNPQVIGLEITAGGVSVTFRVPSNVMYACYPPRRAPDKVWREEYVTTMDKNGVPVLVLDDVVEGKHVPASQVEEKVVWPDDKGKEPVQERPWGLGGISNIGGVSAAPWDGTTTAS